MNSDQCAGLGWIVLGRVEEFLGFLLASERCRRRGFEHRIAGEARQAVGHARQVIAHCRRTSQRDIRDSHRKSPSEALPASGNTLHTAALVSLPWLHKS